LLRKLIVSAGAALALTFAVVSPAAAIVGGGPATTTAPYMVSVIAAGWLGDSHACGGFLVGTRSVVTAAHCVDGKTAADLKVKYGGVDRNQLAVTSAVSSISENSNFNAETMTADVAVLGLASPIVTSSTVGTIELATAAPNTGDSLTVTGWGKITADDTAPPVDLRTVRVPVTTTSICQSANGGLNLSLGGNEGGLLDGLDPVLDTGSMFCAGPAEGGQGFCTGDSGGPAVGADGTVYGIVSWSRGCAQAGSPGVYTSIAAYRNWIVSKIV
jgi:trypsin